MPNVSEEWFRRTVEESWRAQQEEIGSFNLAIFGKTGVGKSTLVNAIFGETIAETGIGEPVTRGHHLYKHASGSLGVFDTEGLEIGKDDETILDELAGLVTDLKKRPVHEQIHVAWYCVGARGGRFEAVEEHFVRRLRELGLPVLVVLTQVPSRDGVPHGRAVELAEHIASLGLPIAAPRPFLTMAEPDSFDGPAHGLEALLDATFRVAPAAVHEALIQAQRIDLARKRKSCQAPIAAAVSAAAAAGASPIPFSDAALLIPIQLGMLSKIALTYNIPFQRATGMAFAMTAAGTGAGRSVVTNLVKLVPGGGTVVGGTISAGVASTITYAMGHAWVEICDRIARGDLSPAILLDSSALRNLFTTEFKTQARKRITGKG
ncbi:GTPase family protein [Nocardioides bruguierae]|uniref:GTP-binding DUF697 domain-containing protein n=1 Tax=Nocardioides bruguierae TaxID=2945102 RepID=A0A9X2D582_9ACTN|nr:GTPase [Nocardioides bruguierae]MCM0619515.1 GTP-binding DUF697 domain-containing protein [Nocardioides bruguierae]